MKIIDRLESKVIEYYCTAHNEAILYANDAVTERRIVKAIPPI